MTTKIRLYVIISIKFISIFSNEDAYVEINEQGHYALLKNENWKQEGLP